MLARLLFHPGNESGRADLMLLLLRLVIGLYLIVGGYNKFMHAAGPTGWMGPTSPYPGSLLFLVAFVELVGGLGLIFGLASRLSALGVVCVTGALVGYHHTVLGGRPFVRSAVQLPVPPEVLPSWLVQGAGQGNYAYEACMFVVALTILVLGPGRISIDALIYRVFAPRQRVSFLPAQ